MAKKQFDIKAVTLGLRIDSGKSRTLKGGVIPYGENNTYPNEVFQAMRLSPTAKGCVKRRSEYTFGEGLKDGGDIIVNRRGETLNQIVRNISYQFSWLDSYVLHFNYNLLGQITEISTVDIRFVRKTSDLLRAKIDIFKRNAAVFASGKSVEIFLYNPDELKNQIKEDGGLKKFKGNIYYYTVNNQIYSLATGDASLPSAQLQSEIQVYNYASIMNGFSADGVIKIPTMQNDGEEKRNIEAQIRAMSGSGNAGSKLVMEVPLNTAGTQNNVNIFEPFQLSNIDKMFVEQTKNAETNILSEYNTPKILLGVSDNGMFNQASFADASDYFNTNTGPQRKSVEDSLNNFWPNTIFYNEVEKLELQPLPMFKIAESEGGDDGSNSNDDTGDQAN